MAEEVSAEIHNVEQIVVKRGLSRFCAESIHPIKARELIYNGILNALKKADKIEPFKLEEPIKLEIDYFSSNMAETASLIPGVARTTPRTVEVTSDAETIFKLQNLMVFRLKDSY